MRKISLVLLAAIYLSYSPARVCAESVAVTGLRAEFRDGQVFLCWSEPAGDHGGTFSAYLSDRPITSDNLPRARRLASRIEAHSARDWWKDPATYFREEKTEPAGFVIREGAGTLDPAGGLFVHTVGAGEPGKAYYAVTCSREGIEDSRIVPGENSLALPVEQRRMPVQPIWLGPPGEKPAPGSAEGRPAVLSLHGRAGSETVTWLAFGDAEIGWREGLPFQFHAAPKAEYLQITPTDRTWVGRTLSESWDPRDHFSPAIDTFWYGYNDRIYDREQMASGTPVNYTERRNLWILRWAQGYFRPDSARIVLEGGSMGGCGGLSWGLRHPELFIAVVADVPLVGYFGSEWGGSEKRLTAFCGPLDRPDNEGALLRERMDSRTVLAEAAAKGIDLPLLHISNGRRDQSIPWKPNPRYYQALNASRQGFMAAWDNRDHATCMQDEDPWFRKWHDPQHLFRLSLKESFPAFSNYSLNGDPGEGDPEEGDTVGYMNFGLEWKDLVDEPGRYEVTVFVAAGAPDLPATVDVTPRRVQRFRPDPGEEVLLIERAPDGREVLRRSARADSFGKVTFAGFRIIAPEGNRLEIIRNASVPLDH
jgi:hypothetical protein